MKAEINNENKARFFALYYDQAVLFRCSFVKGEDLRNVLNGNDELEYGQKAYLHLKPLSKISDKDAIEVFDYIFGGREANKNKSRKEKITFGKEWASCYGKFFNYGSGHFGYETGNVIDLLRSKSYALPWMNLSVEEMIGSGWIKLIEE